MLNLNIKPKKVYRFAIKPSNVVMSQVLHACILYDDDDDDMMTMMMGVQGLGRQLPPTSPPSPPLNSSTIYKRAPIDNLKKR